MYDSHRVCSLVDAYAGCGTAFTSLTAWCYSNFLQSFTVHLTHRLLVLLEFSPIIPNIMGIDTVDFVSDRCTKAED